MDFDAVSKIDTQIMHKLSQPQQIEIPAIEPVVETKPEAGPEQDNQFTPREQAYISEWANEMMPDGMNFSRPWAQDWHPLNEFALDQTKALLKHPSFKNSDLETILATVDNIMQPKTQAPAQEKQTKETKNPPEVLSADGNLRTTKKESKLTLTQDQMMVAERIYPKLSAKDAHTKYLGGLKQIQNL
jgi:hypothetical protein